MHGHKIVNQDGLHFLTFTVVGWIDVFTRMKYKDIIIHDLEYCIKNKGLILCAYVIMSNHVHIIGRADDGYNLSDIIRDFKSHSSKTILNSILTSPNESRQEWMLKLFKYYAKYNSNNKTYQFWKRDNKPIELVSPKWIDQKINYIHNNPINAGLVENSWEYRYSSAANNVEKEGLLNISLIDLGFDIGYVN